MLYYNFLIAGRNVGYYEFEDTGNELYGNATFEIGGQVVSNKFAVRYSGREATGYKVGDGKWQTQGLETPDHFPSSAYDLLIREWEGDRSYQCVKEESGEVMGATQLVGRELAIGGLEISESREGRFLRAFVVDSGKVVSIDWGGAISELCTSFEQATTGTVFETSSS